MGRTVLLLIGAAGAALVAPPASSARMAAASCAAGTSRSAPPAMILDQMKKAAKDLEGAAAEAIVRQKVEEKLAKAKEKYDIPEQYEGVMQGFFTSYMTSVYKAGRDTDYYETVLTRLFKEILEKTKEPYKFPPYHKAIREPLDYYALGNEFATGVINREDSALMGLDQLEKIKEQVAAGDNVVLFANHQSEADPQIFSVLLDPSHPGFAEETIFVAGDRVTTDLLAQPFSMGRNLLCIYSKKHIENPPELKSEKSRHNRNVMKQMGNLFKEGGKVIWVAPSGGRDRKTDGKYSVADFDPKAVDMFRLMAGKADTKTHFYPLSMLTYPVCPPPEAVGGTIGESRTVAWAPAGLYWGEEIDVDAMMADVPEDLPDDVDPKDYARDALTSHVHKVVAENYKVLEKTLDKKLS